MWSLTGDQMESSELQVDSWWTPENSVVICLFLRNPGGLQMESTKSTRTTWSPPGVCEQGKVLGFSIGEMFSSISTAAAWQE